MDQLTNIVPLLSFIYMANSMAENIRVSASEIESALQADLNENEITLLLNIKERAESITIESEDFAYLLEDKLKAINEKLNGPK